MNIWLSSYDVNDFYLKYYLVAPIYLSYFRSGTGQILKFHFTWS